MRRVVKVLVWTAVFAACFGVGAFVAANTDPFPPGVEDPGERPAPDASASDGAAPAWTVRIDVRSHHDLFVGGRCAAAWRVDLILDAADPSLTGAGVATRKGRLRCDEPTAQVQADEVMWEVAGSSKGGHLRFRLRETGRSPEGSQELSGLVQTLPTLRFRLPAHEGASASFDITVPDGDRGSYGAAGEAVLRPPSG